MLERIDYWASGIISAIGAVFTYLYGDLNTLSICLFGFIVLDYITGLLVAIGNKELSSAIGFKGICKKVCIIILVGVGHLLDRTLGLQGVAQSMVCCFYIANEGISIMENSGNLGLPVPQKIVDLLLSVKRKGENDYEITDIVGEDEDNDPDCEV